MKRVNPKPKQKKRLLEANAARCCVCKRSSIGFHFHHIDGDSSNTIDENLAVLCVEDHDAHHRPGEYLRKVNHIELGANEITRFKHSWEAFVVEAGKPAPSVVATLASYGTPELIHSLQLVLQWPDERIEYKRSFHLLDGNLDLLTTRVFEELTSIGPNIKLAVVDDPLPVEHCPCCGSGFSYTLKAAVVARNTDPKWSTDSVCSIYINPNQPSVAIVIFLEEQQLLIGSLHRCHGTHLHYYSGNFDDRIPLQPGQSIRAQAMQVVKHLLEVWSPARVLIGTGDPDQPNIISDLEFPELWEL